MAVAKSNNTTQSSSSSSSCNCYRVRNLTEPVLDANQISNLKDRYTLGEQLGWGQFGVIRECYDKFTHELLACKSIAKDRLVTEEDVQSIRLEIEIMTRLSGHPNVVDLKAVYEDEDYVHLVMELCAGGELFCQLEKQGKFTESEAKVLFRHLMQVVTYCHDNGVVHRDLKPENILLATKSPSSPIKVADFGLATYITQGQNLHGTVGSPFYIAPEVLAGGYNQSADVWSAGVILYILLSGVPPFWGNTKSRIFDAVRTAELRFPNESWDNVSSSSKELIKGMLCKDPTTRLTAQQVLDHTWMMDLMAPDEEQYGCQKQNSVAMELLKSPSSLLLARDQDFSFNSALPIINNDNMKLLPDLECKSSFSSFLMTPPTPTTSSLDAVGFSFQCSNGGSSNGLEIPTCVLSMPSFAFFNGGGASMVEQTSLTLNLSGDIRLEDSLHREASLGAILVLPDSSMCFENASTEEERSSEIKRGGGVSSRNSGIHNRRNNTISFGEVEQLDLMVTEESVIRWASCTRLPTAMSLRSSLVC